MRFFGKALFHPADILCGVPQRIVLRADQARTVTAFYKTYYETDSSFLVDLEASGLLGSL